MSLLFVLACSVDQSAVGPIDGIPVDPVGLTPPTDVPVTSDARTTPELVTLAPAVRDPQGSSTLVTSADGNQSFVVDEDNGTVVRIDNVTGETHTAVVGIGPSRITRVDDTLYVSLRGERSLVQLDTDLNEVARAHVGSEPVGVVARRDGQRVYVAVSQQNEVIELDASLQVLARVPISGEPRYLALSPDGMHLYVGSGRGIGKVSALSLASLTLQDIPLPSTWNMEADLTPRITGDLAVVPFLTGHRLAIPTLYVDTDSPIPDLSSIDDIVEAPPNGFPGEGEGGYGGAGLDLSRLNPSIVHVGINESGTVVDTPLPLFVGHTDDPFADPFFAEDEGLEITTRRSYINQVLMLPGNITIASMQAADAVMVLDENRESFSFSFMFPPEAGGFREAPLVAYNVPNPMGLGQSATNALIHAPFDHALHQVGLLSLRQSAEFADEFGGGPPTDSVLANTYASSPLTTMQQEGRDLFYSSVNQSMGVGASCSTCHFEGRNDGLTFMFDGGLRQTPTLAGVVSQTAPVTWASNVDSVGMEADLTTRGRMGGQGLTTHQLSALEAYVDSTPLPDPPDVLDAAAVARGAEIFAEASCTSCHSGQNLTDNQSYTMNAGLLNTPRLIGIAATSPYLVDGSAATLRDVIERAQQPGEMGSTAHLDEAGLDDLEAYLRSL